MFIIIITICHPAVGDGPTRTIVLHGGDWDSLKLNNAICSFILKTGYGYDTNVLPGPERTITDQLSSGEVDISLEVWKENHPPALQDAIDAGKISDYGKIYSKASHIYIIPRHIADQFNISTVIDMQRHWMLCRDPEEASRGLMFTGITSWLAHDITLGKMDAYGLSPYYSPVTMPSGRSYEAIFMKAAEQNRTVFGLYWTPSSVMGTGYWKAIDEPTKASSQEGQATSYSGNTPVRPFPVSDVHKLASAQLQSHAPEIISFLSAMKPGDDEISKVLASGYRQREYDWNILAIQYLVNNQDMWKTWVNTEAYQRISAALNKPGGGN